MVPKGRQIAISRLSGRGGNLFIPSNGIDLKNILKENIIYLPQGADTPEFCYLLRSCSKRIIDNVLCTIGENNFLDVKLFTTDLSACRDHCETTEGCR